MRLFCWTITITLALISCYTNNFSVGWEPQPSLYKAGAGDIFIFYENLCIIYKAVFAGNAMQPMQSIDWTWKPGPSPPARKRPFMANLGQVRNIYSFYVREVRGKLCDAEMVLISPVSSDNLPLTCCCRPHPSPPLYSRTLYRSQHHSSLSAGGISTRNNPDWPCPPHTTRASPCTSPAERSPPPC